MMILLCELAIKSEGTRFRLLWTIKYQAVIILNNFFPYQKTKRFVLRYLQVGLSLAQGPWVEYQSP